MVGGEGGGVVWLGDLLGIGWYGSPSPRPSPARGEGDVLRVLRVLWAVRRGMGRAWWRLGVLREMGAMRGGRTIGLKKPAVLAQFRLVEVLGESAANDVHMGMVLPLMFVVSIDDQAEPTAM